MLALFNNDAVTGYAPLAFPIFLQEMVLAVWLIARGFDPRAIASAAAAAIPAAGVATLSAEAAS